MARTQIEAQALRVARWSVVATVAGMLLGLPAAAQDRGLLSAEGDQLASLYGRDRGFGEVEHDLQPPTVNEARRSRVVPAALSLPTSMIHQVPLSTAGDGVLFGRLVRRAEAAVAEGRPAQARSDLATARGLLVGVDPGLAPMRARMVAMEERLANAGR